MNWLRLSPLIILGIANVVIAGAVWARDFRKLNNIAFAVFALSIGSWVLGITGFLLTTDKNTALMWAQLYYAAPLFIAVSGYFFAISFPFSEAKRRYLQLPLILGFLLLLVPLIFDRSYLMKDLRYHSWGKEVILNHYAYGTYTFYIVFFFLTILLTMQYKAKKLHGLYALQAKLFFQGLSLTAAFGLLFNLVLPLFGNYHLIGLGPLFTSISVTAIGYNIIRHRMFDVRLVVARTMGYGLALIVLSSLYGFVGLGIGQLFFGLHISIAAQIFLSAATGVAALLFSRLKKNFDKLTNRLFYRDAYDPQDLFDKLNQILVSTLDLDRLLHQVATLLGDELKAGFCLIGLKEIVGKPMRIIGTEKRDIAFKDVMTVRKLTVKYHQTVIAVDYLEEGKSADLKRLLTRNNVAILVRLAPNVMRNEEGLGYVVLGPKKSGNPYINQDFRVLETVANELIIAIQNALHFEEIQNFNVTLQEKVDLATKEIRRSNEKLKALDETKDDFISMASHQLRTPLTSIKGYLSMVLEGDAGKLTGTERKMLAQAFASSQRMVYLISDLLNVSRLKTGKFVINAEPINLAELITDEINQLKETAASRSVELTYNKPAHFPKLMLDETKTRQVVMNFVDNALYYTPAGGHITVEVEDKPATIELRVVDDGIGVPKNEQHHLFTKFYRARNARKARPDGTGLGLFMAKKVVAAQGGAIIFKSQEGKGSTFGFTFSKTKLAPPAAPTIAQD